MGAVRPARSRGLPALAVVVALVLSCATWWSGGETGDDVLGRHLQYPSVDSRALAGNLAGDPHVRELAVLLPPSYFRTPARTFPTVYLLHGVGPRRDGHRHSVYLLRAMYEHMKEGRLAEMIVVAVDGSTSFGGSYYASSPTIGDFPSYIADEIVTLVDARYRTRPERKSRAIAGFSMGGHGAVKLAMRRSDVFGILGSLSGSPLSIRYRHDRYRSAVTRHQPPQSLEELRATVTYEKSWALAAAYAKAAAFSPNPARPPLFLDLPFAQDEAGGEDPIWTAWLEDDPLALVERHHRELRSLALIYMDHGDAETTLGTEEFDGELTRHGIAHVHHIFRGDHTDQLPERCFRMLRQFADVWAFP